MSDEVYSETAGNLDGTSIDFSVSVDDRQGKHLFQYVNNTDVDITINLYGTRSEDSGFNDTVSIGTTSVLTTENGAGFISDPWEILHFVVSFSANPSTGSFNVYEMTEV